MIVENEKSVVFTEAAALKVQTLIDEEDASNRAAPPCGCAAKRPRILLPF